MPVATAAIIQAWDEEFFRSAVVSGTAPLASYALTTLNSNRPAARVLFGSGTVTITLTTTSPVQGDVFVLPTSNLDPGVLTLTNGAGLNVAVPVPNIDRGKIPKTTVIDLTVAQPTAGTRTSNVWNLVIAGNSANVLLGGAVLLYGPRHVLTRDFLGANIIQNFTGGQIEQKNEYLVRYIQTMQTYERVITYQAYAASDTEANDIIDEWKANYGNGLPGLFWPNPTVNDGYFGTFAQSIEVAGVEAGGSNRLRRVSMEFHELVKGKPVA